MTQINLSTKNPVIFQKIETAFDKRWPIIESFDKKTTLWRWIHDLADDFPGITLDQVGPALLLEQHTSDAKTDDIINFLQTKYPQSPVFFKKRYSNSEQDRCGSQILGPSCPNKFQVWENGLSFWINLCAGEHIGVFADTREARTKTKTLAKDKRVLNLFSYTCGFSLFAAAAGAKSTVNIDNKNSALQIGKENYLANNLNFDNRSFFKCDVLYYLKRAAKQKGKFDLVIVDPPPQFKRRHNSDFQLHLHLNKLLLLILPVCDKDALILLGINSLKASDNVIQEALLEINNNTNYRLEVLETIGPGMDYQPCPTRPVARFFLCRLSI